MRARREHSPYAALAEHHGLARRRFPYMPETLRAGWRRYVGAVHPRYDLGRIEVRPAVHSLLVQGVSADTT